MDIPIVGSTSIWTGAPKPESVEEPLVSLLEPIYKRPQGEMLHALCKSFAPFFAGPYMSQGKVCEIFSELLTRNGVSVRCPMTLLR
jgi:hypothetical protein